jgi:hypothetical protein
MRSVVVVTLATNVARDGIEVGCAERLGPVTVLPSETTSRGCSPMPIMPSTDNGDHDPAIDAWRQRMQQSEAKETYRARAGLCELSNAHLKQHHGVAQLLVRGLEKVTCVALLAALSQNIVQHATNLLS